MKITVDRREEECLAVILPDGECVNISSKLCPEAKEGDIIKIEISEEDTKDVGMRIKEKLDALKNREIDK